MHTDQSIVNIVHYTIYCIQNICRWLSEFLGAFAERNLYRSPGDCTIFKNLQGSLRSYLAGQKNLNLKPKFETSNHHPTKTIKKHDGL